MESERRAYRARIGAIQGQSRAHVYGHHASACDPPDHPCDLVDWGARVIRAPTCGRLRAARWGAEGPSPLPIGPWPLASRAFGVLVA